MTMPGRPRLYLIDGYALIYRAFYALGGGAPLRNAHGENTGMAKGVNDFLKRLIEKHKPDYLGWVNDAGSSGARSSSRRTRRIVSHCRTRNRRTSTPACNACMSYSPGIVSRSCSSRASRPMM